MLLRDFVFYPTAICSLLQKVDLVSGKKEFLVLYIEVRAGAILIRKTKAEVI